MKRLVVLIWVFAAVGTIGCKHGPDAVRAISLRDDRLPIDARRWLADTEDEVAIARAQTDDAEQRLLAMESYLAKLKDETIFVSKDGQRSSALEQVLVSYVKEIVALRAMDLDLAQKQLQLALARQTLVRAETAIRYDLAIYEMDPIVEAVDNWKAQVAAAKIALEKSRASVESSADKFWADYAAFVKKGGGTSAFWKFRSRISW